ncbi:hypothetical protein FQA39_LY12871 [Lamprigera yunnana]|nr:hypothetical protein FQA39_LY12871 [Lamprigera yunnana]
MIGLKIGNDQAIEITFPENYTPELAEIPARDDELAKDLNVKGISTFKDLEKKVKEDIQKQKQTGVKNQFVNELIVEIAKDSEIALPKKKKKKKKKYLPIKSQMPD